MKEEENNLKKEITKILIELGIPINLQGFSYFREGVLLAINQPNVLAKVTKDFYPRIGDYFEVKATAVERCMRHAADLGYLKTGFKLINNYFNIESDIYDYKPTNSELVALIAEYLKMENFVAM